MARRSVTVTFTPAQVGEVRGAILVMRDMLVHETGHDAAVSHRTLGNALDRLNAADIRAHARPATAWERTR